MRSNSPWSQPPELLAAFAPEYKQEHYHLHGRNIENWQSFRSIFLDEHFQGNKLGKKVLKGALVGAMYGILARTFMFRGPKSSQMDRLWLLKKGNPNVVPLRGYTAFGAVMGAAWWVIKDVICIPHSQNDTYENQLLAYGLIGAVLAGTIVHPVNALYGFFAGVVGGGLYTSIWIPSYPKNFELKMKNLNEAKRARLLREDEEYELSSRNSLVTRTNLYPL